MIWLTAGQGGYNSAHCFLERKIGAELLPGTIFAVKGGAVLFNNYHPHEGVIELHAAAESKRWLTRKVLWEMFSFPFRQLGCQAVIMRAAVDNEDVRRVAEPYGFKRYEIPRLRGRDKPEAIYVLGDDEWAANGFHRELKHG